MSSMYPVSGTFSVFGARFVSSAFGFTLGWSYYILAEQGLTMEQIFIQAGIIGLDGVTFQHIFNALLTHTLPRTRSISIREYYICVLWRVIP